MEDIIRLIIIIMTILPTVGIVYGDIYKGNKNNSKVNFGIILNLGIGLVFLILTYIDNTKNIYAILPVVSIGNIMLLIMYKVIFKKKLNIFDFKDNCINNEKKIFSNNFRLISIAFFIIEIVIFLLYISGVVNSDKSSVCILIGIEFLLTVNSIVYFRGSKVSF